MPKRLVIKIYEKFFGEEISFSVLNFLKNLKFVTFGYVSAALCVFIFQIWSGRVLGPEEYGKYALVDSIGSFMFLLMTFGINIATIKHIADQKEETIKKKIISSSFLISIIFIVFACLIF